MSTGDSKDEGRPETPDGELIARLARSDAKALEALYLRYGTDVFNLLKRSVPGFSRSELEDLRQDVFLSLVDAAPTYREQGKFRSWLYSIAVRKARDQWRTHRRRRRLLTRHFWGLLGSATARDDASAHQAAARMDVSRALDRLPDGQREVLVLHAIQGLTGEEIADVLGIRPKTVWTRLHRARRSLRQWLQKAGTEACEGEVT